MTKQYSVKYQKIILRSHNSDKHSTPKRPKKQVSGEEEKPIN